MVKRFLDLVVLNGSIEWFLMMLDTRSLNVVDCKIFLSITLLRFYPIRWMGWALWIAKCHYFLMNLLYQ